jgi:four helix bundle protein
MRDFKKLIVWQRSQTLAVRICEQARQFPRSGFGNLRSQLERAADSIATNIVEGCGAASQREFSRYLDISIKSANEVEHHLLTARDRGALSPDDWRLLTAELIEIRRMLFGLRKKILIEAAGAAQRS